MKKQSEYDETFTIQITSKELKAIQTAISFTWAIYERMLEEETYKTDKEKEQWESFIKTAEPLITRVETLLNNTQMTHENWKFLAHVVKKYEERVKYSIEEAKKQKNSEDRVAELEEYAAFCEHVQAKIIKNAGKCD